MSEAVKGEVEIYGLAVSIGIGMGPAYVLPVRGIHLPTTQISPENIQHEIDRLDQAWQVSIQQIENDLNNRPRDQRDLQDNILEFHYLLAQDMQQETSEKCQQLIREKLLHAETAFDTALQAILKKLSGSPLMRSEDASGIGDLVLHNLAGLDLARFDDIQQPVILVADDLSPSQTIRLPREKVLAFATHKGSRTSHTAIMARALEIPAVVGLPDLLESVEEGDFVIVDGDRGRVLVRPRQETIDLYQRRSQILLIQRQEFERYRDLPAETPDGFVVNTAANIELPEEVDTALSQGAWGIGLYRTEFLFMKRADLPDEEEQYEAYRSVVSAMHPMPVVIRTLDVGGDKLISAAHIPYEDNPSMGCRAIRFCLEQPEIFIPQLRAILRAAVHRNVSILFPMISEVRELRLTRQLLNKVCEDLKKEGIEHNPDLPIGVMIEVPSAALVADQLAEMCDFFSIGTNDLVQYTLAADRGNERTAYLNSPLHPSVLRLIREVIEAAHNRKMKVSMCGEMAGQIEFTILLLGLMLDELSMSPISIPRVKRLIRTVALQDAVEIARQAMVKGDVDEIRAFLEKKTRTLVPWAQDLMDEVPSLPSPGRSNFYGIHSSTS